MKKFLFLFEENKELAMSIAYRWRRKLPDPFWPDVENSALIGLYQAALRRGGDESFLPYANLRINGEIMSFLRTTDYLSRNLRNLVSKIKRLKFQKPDITTEEIASVLGVEPSVIDEFRNSKLISLESLSGENRPAWEEFLSHEEENPEEAFLKRERLKLIQSALGELDERRASLILDYYFDEKLGREIAEELSVTGPRISQLISTARGRLKKIIAEKGGE